MIKINKEQILKEYFGHTSFREGQEKIIDALLSGRDVMGIMPTGAGKSLCFQVPALMMKGITLVISPLISLMKDQVNSLVQNGIKAAYLNSSLTYNQYLEAIRRAKLGAYKIIYVAPERLMTESFRDFVSKVDISMLVVDEAHCISQWGQDFRPDYLKIAQFVNGLVNRPVLCALTATATQLVKEDIINILNLNSPFELTTGFDRENLYFGVIHASSKFERLLGILRKNKQRCIIIYCNTRKNVENVCEKLQKNGYKATRYHAGLEDWERKENQEDFQNDIYNIMVATSAFGMGIDKSNVSMVIHYNIPKSIEEYYQEAGRAGRDGSESECIIFYSVQDVFTNKLMIEKNEPNPHLTPEENIRIKELDLNRLRDMVRYCETTKCLRGFLLDYFGDKTITQCNKCMNCQSDFVSKDITKEAKKIFLCIDELDRRHKAFGKTMLCDILRGKEKDSRVSDYRLYNMVYFGILSQYKNKEVQKYIDALLELKYLFTNTDKYNVIELTQKAIDAIRENSSIIIKIREETENNTKSKKATTKETENKDLFNELKKLRMHIASTKGIPPYVVFTDMTLRAMADNLPKDEEELLQITGVGSLKLKKYGKEFLGVINRYRKEK